MSGIINLLPDSIANQIAAGEVIQRPASAVKEMLENSLDAQSSKISLIIKDSGKTLIQVVDNGNGMSAADARMCFERHATSKIQNSDDLFKIQSFGFRGEALASIAAVAHVELITRRATDEVGTHIVIAGSKVVKQEPCQAPVGTSLAVKNLFFNVPARRKFLKSDPVELKHILEEFVRVALPNPDVHFSVYHNDNELYHFPPSKLRQRIVNYFGKNTNEKIIPVKESADFLSIQGFVGKAEMVKKKRGEQYLFVNNRFIKSNYINHAIKSAYENIIPDNTYPFFVLLLDIDPAMIDINIHPTKQEIKFENERVIYNYVRVAVKHALGRYSIAPSLDFDVENQASTTLSRSQHTTNPQHNNIAASSPSRAPSQGGRSGHSGNTPSFRQASKKEKEEWIDFYKNIQETAESLPQEPASSTHAITLHSNWDSHDDNIEPEEPRSKSSFQVFDKYIVSPIKSGLLVIDQQVAHERILFEKYKDSVQNRQILSEKSLFPETIQVNAQNQVLLEELLPELKKLGFDMEQQEDNRYIIHTVPAEGLKVSAQEFIENFIDAYHQNLANDVSLQENIARAMALHSGIKRGQKLSTTEIQTLVDQLFACEMPYQSPSGKKCFVTIGQDDFTKLFNT